MLGILSGGCTNIPQSSGNQIAWDQCGAMRISSYWSHCAFSSTRGNRDGGGYVYAHSVFQLIDRTSTPMADGSGTEDTNSGSFWFHLVVNRSNNGIPHSRVSARKTDGCREHSVPAIWEGRDRMSARTFNLPGMCHARSTIWLVWHQRSSFLVRLHRCIDHVPARLLM